MLFLFRVAGPLFLLAGYTSITSVTGYTGDIGCCAQIQIMHSDAKVEDCQSIKLSSYILGAKTIQLPHLRKDNKVNLTAHNNAIYHYQGNDLKADFFVGKLDSGVDIIDGVIKATDNHDIFQIMNCGGHYVVFRIDRSGKSTETINIENDYHNAVSNNEFGNSNDENSLDDFYDTAVPEDTFKQEDYINQSNQNEIDQTASNDPYNLIVIPEDDQDDPHDSTNNFDFEALNFTDTEPYDFIQEQNMSAEFTMENIDNKTLYASMLELSQNETEANESSSEVSYITPELSSQELETLPVTDIYQKEPTLSTVNHESLTLNSFYTTSSPDDFNTKKTLHFKEEVENTISLQQSENNALVVFKQMDNYSGSCCEEWENKLDDKIVCKEAFVDSSRLDKQITLPHNVHLNLISDHKDRLKYGGQMGEAFFRTALIDDKEILKEGALVLKSGRRYMLLYCSSNKQYAWITKQRSDESIMNPTQENSVEPTITPIEESIVIATLSLPNKYSLGHTIEPTFSPYKYPALSPTNKPTISPTHKHTLGPANNPTSVDPTNKPTFSPYKYPSLSSLNKPTWSPNIEPTLSPINKPTSESTIVPTFSHYWPSLSPSNKPTKSPTRKPTWSFTIEPTEETTVYPSGKNYLSYFKKDTYDPNNEPTLSPTFKPIEEPIVEPNPSYDQKDTYGFYNKPILSPTLKPNQNKTTAASRIQNDSFVNRLLKASGIELLINLNTDTNSDDEYEPKDSIIIKLNGSIEVKTLPREKEAQNLSDYSNGMY